VAQLQRLKSGASPGSPLHFVGDPTAKRMYVTEGPLKGSVAHSLTGHTFLCVPGVNNTSALGTVLGQISATGTTEIVEAFDMDKTTNHTVGTAAKKLCEMLEGCGFKVMSTIWDNKELKGIEDYYFAKWNERQKMVREVSISKGLTD